MKIFSGKLIVLIIVIMFYSLADSCLASDEDSGPFLGRWALYLPGGAGWLEVNDQDGYLDADMLWYGGSVVPVAHVYLRDGKLIVTRISKEVVEKDEEDNPVRTHTVTQLFEFERSGDDLLKGFAVHPEKNGSGIQTTGFTAKKIPVLPDPPDLKALKYGKAIKIFNGKDLDGWELTDKKRKNGFKVVDGSLVNDPVQPEGGKHVSYGNLRTVDTFEDFNLKIDVNIPEGNNSGIYLRGIYEVQVYDSYGKPLDSHNMGAVYSRITPKVSAEKPAGEWQHFDITLCQRHINVVLNGETIIANHPLYGVTGGALTADEFIPGPMYLQGDHGKVSYRNIVLTPILNNK